MFQYLSVLLEAFPTCPKILGYLFIFKCGDLNPCLKVLSMRVELVDSRLHSRNQWLGCWVRKFWSRLTLNFPLELSKAPGKTLPGVLSGEGGPWCQCYQSLMGKRAEGLHTQHALIYPVPPFSTRHWWPSVCQVFPVKGLSSPEDKPQCGCVESRWLVSFFWQSGRRTQPVFKQISKHLYFERHVTLQIPRGLEGEECVVLTISPWKSCFHFSSSLK